MRYRRAGAVAPDLGRVSWILTRGIIRITLLARLFHATRRRSHSDSDDLRTQAMQRLGLPGFHNLMKFW